MRASALHILSLRTSKWLLTKGVLYSVFSFRCHPSACGYPAARTPFLNVLPPHPQPLSQQEKEGKAVFAIGCRVRRFFVPNSYRDGNTRSMPTEANAMLSDELRSPSLCAICANIHEKLDKRIGAWFNT